MLYTHIHNKYTLASIYHCIYELHIISLLNITKENKRLAGNITKGMKSIVDIGCGGFADGHTRLKLPGRGH